MKAIKVILICMFLCVGCTPIGRWEATYCNSQGVCQENSGNIYKDGAWECPHKRYSTVMAGAVRMTESKDLKEGSCVISELP